MWIMCNSQVRGLKKQLAKLKAEGGAHDKQPTPCAPSTVLEPGAAGEGGGRGEQSGRKEGFDGSGGGRKEGGAEVGVKATPRIGWGEAGRDRLRERRERQPPTPDMVAQSVRRFGATLAPGCRPPPPSLPLPVPPSRSPSLSPPPFHTFLALTRTHPGSPAECEVRSVS